MHFADMSELIYIPSFNCERTIGSVIKEIRNIVPNSFVLVVDDSSTDNSYLVAKDLADYVIRTPTRLGYGGNQKIAFKFFVENSFEKIVMIHGDGQHNPLHIPRFLECIDQKKADLVIGSRMLNKSSAINGGMPIIKFISNIFLSYIENKVLGLNLSEFHSGYRCYSARALRAIYSFIPMLSDDFVFDQQIIFLMHKLGFKICEIPVETIYNQFSSHIKLLPGIKYFFEVLILSSRYCIFKKVL